jgi:hypothetical protein
LVLVRVIATSGLLRRYAVNGGDLRGRPTSIILACTTRSLQGGHGPPLSIVHIVEEHHGPYPPRAPENRGGE